MRLSYFPALLSLTIGISAFAATPKKPLERTVSVGGFRGKVALHQLQNDRVEVYIKTNRGVTVDTIPGHTIFPVLVNGKKQPFYFGKFGASKFPMLVFAVSDPDRA